MTTLPDLIFVTLFAVAGPLIDYSVFWPAYRRLSQADPAWARRWLWASAIGSQWTLVLVGVALWVASSRSWTSFGFTVPDGWRLWIAVALSCCWRPTTSGRWRHLLVAPTPGRACGSS